MAGAKVPKYEVHPPQKRPVTIECDFAERYRILKKKPFGTVVLSSTQFHGNVLNEADAERCQSAMSLGREKWEVLNDFPSSEVSAAVVCLWNEKGMLAVCCKQTAMDTPNCEVLAGSGNWRGTMIAREDFRPRWEIVVVVGNGQKRFLIDCRACEMRVYGMYG